MVITVNEITLQRIFQPTGGTHDSESLPIGDEPSRHGAPKWATHELDGPLSHIGHQDTAAVTGVRGPGGMTATVDFAGAREHHSSMPSRM